MARATIERVRLYHQVADLLQDRILSGHYAIGDRLPNEKELSEEFEVSRTVVREAIKALAERGLVEVKHGSGIYVTAPTSRVAGEAIKLLLWSSKERFEGLQEVREILEPAIAARAAERARVADLAYLRGVLADMAAATQDRDRWIALDLDFHIGLGRATGNPVILTLIDPIVSLTQEFRKLIFDFAGGSSGTLEEHGQILAGVQGRDPAGASEAMRAHLRTVRAKIGALLASAEGLSPESDKKADQLP